MADESFHIDADLTGSSANFDGTGLNTGFTFVPAVDGVVKGIRFRATPTVSGTYNVGLYAPVDDDPPNGSTNGTQLANAAVVGSPAGGAWNVQLFSSSVSVTAGLPYRAVLFSSAGRYMSSGSGFFAAPITRGNLTGIATGSTHNAFILSNGTYFYAGALSYTKDSNNRCFYVDVVFEASGGSTTPVSSDLDSRWRVYQDVSSDLDCRWRISSVVNSDLDCRWRIHDVVTSDLDSRWIVRAAVVSDLDARWRVLDAINSDLDVRWAVRALAFSDLDVRWAVIGRVNSDLLLLWVVGSSAPVVPDVVADFSPILVVAKPEPITVVADFGQ